MQGRDEGQSPLGSWAATQNCTVSHPRGQAGNCDCQGCSEGVMASLGMG